MCDACDAGLVDNNNIVINAATRSIGIFGLSVKPPTVIHIIDLFMWRKRIRLYALNDGRVIVRAAPEEWVVGTYLEFRGRVQLQ